jgi:hypothetical protein
MHFNGTSSICHLHGKKLYPLFTGTYDVRSSCIYHVHELIKLIKNLKKFIYVLSIIFYLCIKFQFPNNERAVKKIKFLIDLKSEIYQKFLFFVIDKP